MELEFGFVLVNEGESLAVQLCSRFYYKEYISKITKRNEDIGWTKEKKTTQIMD